MVPNLFNKICAHPVIVSWTLGACALDVAVGMFILHGVSLESIVSDWSTILLLVLVLIPATALGYFLGMFTCWPLIRFLCSRYNAAPLKVGDQVVILSGSQKGSLAKVYEITVGQGGWNLARLDFGEESAKKFKDIFEEYSLLKIKSVDQDTLQTSLPK